IVGNCRKFHERRHVIVLVRQEVTPEADWSAARAQGIQWRAEHQLRAYLMQRELEPGDDTEVATAALERPEQIRMFCSTGVHYCAVGSHNLRGHQVVDRQTVAAAQPAN